MKNKQPTQEGADSTALKLTPESKEPTSTLKCEFVEASSLVPGQWTEWFWAKISDNAPFSWGDNNRSLVCACDFREHCVARLDEAAEEELVPQSDVDQFLESLEGLGSIYVDLEN